MTKQFWKSKLFWLGVVQIIGAIGMYFTGEKTLEEVLFGASGILVIILRFLTNKGITIN